MDNKSDKKLMKKMLNYARPYSKYILLAMLLMVIITGLELLRPYLIKVSIDDYISGKNIFVYELDINDHPDLDGIQVNNRKYIRDKDVKSIDLSNFNKKQVLKEGNNYYLLDENNNKVEINKEDYQKFREYDLKGVVKISLFFLFTIFIVFILNYLQIYILNYTGQNIIYNLRNDIFSHIQHLPISYFDNNPIGRLVTRVTNDTESLNEMYTGVLVNLFKDVFVLIGIVIIMLRLNFRLTLISLLFTPLIVLAAIIFRKKIRNIYRLGRTQLARINSNLNEYITGMNLIQAFKKEDKIFNSFSKTNREYLDTSLKEVKTFAIFRPTIEIIKFTGIATLLYFGGKDVMNGVIGFGVLYAFIDYLQRFFEPILSITEKYNILQSAIASSEKIFNVLEEENPISNSVKPIKKNGFKGKVEFKNVWFSYDNENWVLKDVSFKIEPGQLIAFVGPTGAGKSSIMNLITRFYDIQKGEILIDGINIKDYDKYNLRRNIGSVLQDVFIFSGSINDNIRLFNQDITDEEIKSISKYVNADKFIERLPNKYNQEVMERGASLSSGERQLLSFARTLAFDPSILILDEATSNIDTETEILIQDALAKLTTNRTTIAVAHRLSTIQNADKIIVLKDGQIVERGNHQELLKEKGMYYKLYSLQQKNTSKKA